MDQHEHQGGRHVEHDAREPLAVAGQEGGEHEEGERGDEGVARRPHPKRRPVGEEGADAHGECRGEHEAGQRRRGGDELSERRPRPIDLGSDAVVGGHRGEEGDGRLAEEEPRADQDPSSGHDQERQGDAHAPATQDRGGEVDAHGDRQEGAEELERLEDPREPVDGGTGHGRERQLRVHQVRRPVAVRTGRLRRAGPAEGLCPGGGGRREIGSRREGLVGRRRRDGHVAYRRPEESDRPRAHAAAQAVGKAAVGVRVRVDASSWASVAAPSSSRPSTNDTSR